MKLTSKIISMDFSKSVYEFHIAKFVRKKYSFGDILFSSSGNVLFADFAAVRKFAAKINETKSDKNKIKPGDINGIGLLDELFHFVFRSYEESNPGVFGRSIEYLGKSLGADKQFKILSEFVEQFPPHDVYSERASVFEYLNSFTGSKANVEIALEELLLLYFDNLNPAAKKIVELFDENYLDSQKIYRDTIDKLSSFFKEEKKIGPHDQDVMSFLSAPIKEFPNDIEKQLEFIRDNWDFILPPELINKILSGTDLIKEEKFTHNAGGGPGPTLVPQYKKQSDSDASLGSSGFKYTRDSWKDYEELEQFTPDVHWMPNVVLLAKNVYVWLDQLSKEYNREIKRLDQVPDEELDRLAKRNFNALWLIGIWERSSASKRIKHLMGNIDAVASAYSLFDYEIASDLGGEWSYNNLNERAKSRGIRLASDMVPNHTGIFSKWTIEHPEYFIQLDNPPFPAYSFTGENLSPDPSIQIRIEDQYYSKTDAAVVFQRIDNRSGVVKYIYHGNDGTNMPWNDTAQLDLLKAEVREAVIQEIMRVARKFSIIRFDAAMTLTKKHFSRLWYPEPGKGGDIPSRSEHSLSKEEFEHLFPDEFWREVVDRINSELPETLLLAEAFWLMEGFFVRSLGMHRVYNSAFMNMFMKEENAKYRRLIINTLEFEPEILKRYVNFMSNPDEETAIKQFGTGDKYFGVSVLMVTLPGLPMFSHGQIEGYSEKYGMEYKRSYYNESPAQWLIERHEKEIFPLMKLRYLFSEVRNFWFYDFVDDAGNINQNVFVYTNSEYDQRSIVFYNNKYEEAGGSIRFSVPKIIDSDKRVSSKSIADALGLKNSPDIFYIFQEHISGLEHIKCSEEFHNGGFREFLGAFKYKVYLNFREVYDTTGKYRRLADRIGNHGVWNINEEIVEMDLEPVHRSFSDIFSDSEFEEAIARILEGDEFNPRSIDPLKKRVDEFITTTAHFYGLKKGRLNVKNILTRLPKQVRQINLLRNELEESGENLTCSKIEKTFKFTNSENYRENSLLILIVEILSAASKLFNSESASVDMIDKLHLDRTIKEILGKYGKSEYELQFQLTLIREIIANENVLFKLSARDFTSIVNKYKYDLDLFFREKKSAAFSSFLDDEFVKTMIGINFYKDVWYFSKENFDDLISWLFTMQAMKLAEKGVRQSQRKKPKSKNKSVVSDAERLKINYLIADSLINAAEISEYRLSNLKLWIDE